MAEQNTPRILVAVSEPVRERVAAILHTCRPTFIAQGGEIGGALGERAYDLVVLGAHFDDSSAIQALEAVVRACPACPIICVLGTRFGPHLGRWTFDAYRAACLELGACDVVDLTQLDDDETGNARAWALFARALEGAGR